MSNIAGLKCKCEKIVDNCGNHILNTCGYGGVRISLHDTILNLLYKFLQICDENVSKETSIDTPEYLGQHKNNYLSNIFSARKSKRCDIMLKSRTSNEVFLLDVCQSQVFSCDKSVQLSLTAAKEANRAINDMIKIKTTKYSKRELIHDAKLIVCAMENTGRFSEVFKKIIYDIIDKSNPPLNNNSTNSSASSLKNFWTKRFSLCFQKTNASWKS
jgi:hypothetical protein